MSELGDLYQEVIIDHNRAPKNFRRIEGADIEAEGFNPLCGDKVTLFVSEEGGRLGDVAFQGSGCAISTASASLLTQAAKGMSREEFAQLFEDFHRMVTSDPTAPPDFDRLGKLAALGGVREFPSRIKCATLVWHTLKQALEGRADEPVRTE